MLTNLQVRMDRNFRQIIHDVLTMLTKLCMYNVYTWVRWMGENSCMKSCTYINSHIFSCFCIRHCLWGHNHFNLNLIYITMGWFNMWPKYWLRAYWDTVLGHCPRSWMMAHDSKLSSYFCLSSSTNVNHYHLCRRANSS